MPSGRTIRISLALGAAVAGRPAEGVAEAGGEADPFADLREEEAAREAPGERPPPAPAPPSGLEVVTRNLSWALEAIGRLGYAPWDASATPGAGVGGELYTQIVTESGTWGTADVQLRAVWPGPNEALRLEVHDATLEKRLLFGRLNIRGGHLRVPFGLEALPIDTHTTVVQLANPRLLGLKHDWGLALRGQLAHVDYDVACTAGSGMPLQRVGAGLAAGRVGWEARSSGFGVGVSGLGGERAAGTSTVFGWRAGADLRHRLGPVEVLAEGSAGEDEDRTVLGALGRVEGWSPGRTVLGVLQYALTRRASAARLHRAELEVGTRLLFLTRTSFLRINLAGEEEGGVGRWTTLVQLYLRHEG